MLTDAGEEIPLSTVVSNCDSMRMHRELVSDSVGEAFERRRRHEPACSGVVLYLGLNKRYEHLAHHDFVFSRDPHEEFAFIYKKGEPAPDPTLLPRRDDLHRTRHAGGRRSALRCSSTRCICVGITIGKRCCPSIGA